MIDEADRDGDGEISQEEFLRIMKKTTRPLGRRSKGRPQRSWDDVIAEVLTKKGETWSHAKVIAEDRKKWRDVVTCQSNSGR
ncbi:EF-hand domain pair [Popillia japonica]|uniref:EF-hand domain pair n=1 Tax=Popillia japonica TaxID=7064 RepID=A0AAW1MWL2_POPJA